MNTVQRKLLNDPEGAFGCDLLCSGDRAVSAMKLMQNAGENAKTTGKLKKKDGEKKTKQTKHGGGRKRAMWWPHSYFRQRTCVLPVDLFPEISMTFSFDTSLTAF